MSATDGANDLKLPLALRVGVSGGRILAAEAIPALRKAIGACLSVVREELSAFAATPAAKAVYRAATDGTVAFDLRVVSPLAEGADRLVAEAGDKAKDKFYFPLPFVQAEYEKDFPDSVAVFRELLAQGEVFELDGDRSDKLTQDESYELVGRYVVANSDFLIAIWDGARARGQGGTGEIVPFAIQVGVPVWWIDAGGNLPPRWLRDGFDLNAPDQSPAGDAAFAALRAWIAKALSPPEYAEPKREGPFGWLARQMCRRWNWDRPPIEDFLAEGPPPRRLPWLANQAMMALAAPVKSVEPPRLAAPEYQAELYWEKLRRAPNLAASAYGDRYRSSYVLIALLAVIALAAAALTGDEGLKTSRWIAVLEFVAVCAIGALVTVNQTHRWHERWISYRLLAELFRKQYALSAIGRALPGSDVSRLAADPDESDQPPRDLWIAWYFMAALRAAPFPTGTMASAKARALHVSQSLVAEQQQYHQTRRDRSLRAGERVKAGSELLFGLTIAFAIGKFLAVIFELEPALHFMVLAGAFLSAGAGAFVGIRAYSEFALLARQSTHMLRMLETVERDLAAVALVVNQPLSSRQIGRTLYSAVGAMMQDITGWAQLFRIKTIEAG